MNTANLTGPPKPLDLDELEKALTSFWSSPIPPDTMFWTGSDDKLRAFHESILGQSFTDEEWAKTLAEMGGEEGCRPIG